MAKYDFQFRKSERKMRSDQTQSSRGKMSFTKSSLGVWREWNDFGDRRRSVSWLFAPANRTVRGSRVTAGQLEPTAQRYANTGCTFVVEAFAVMQ